MKKLVLSVALSLLLVSSLTVFVGCGDNGNNGGNHTHDYVETQIQATCTTEGYNVFTCNECGDSYRGDIVMPVINHVGVGKCTNCNAEFDILWKNFITNHGADGNIGFDGKIGVLLSYTDKYDCLLYAITSDEGKNQRTLTLAYNIYDRKWTWLFDFVNGLGTASGSFAQWSSRSSSLNCTSKTGYITALYTDSELLAEIKTLYNEILNCANSKLKEFDFNITMANFGLEK